MPEITINVTVQQMERMDRVLQNWEIVQNALQPLVYGGNTQMDQDLLLVANFRQWLQSNIESIQNP